MHAASPEVKAPTGELVGVNFSALKRIASAAVAERCCWRPNRRLRSAGKQRRCVRRRRVGKITAAAKAMAMNLIDSIDRRYAPYGVRGYTLAPGFVRGPVSRSRFRSPAQAALLPGEIAEALLALLDGGRAARKYGRDRTGALGPRDVRLPYGRGGFGANNPRHPQPPVPSIASAEQGDKVAAVVRSVFGVAVPATTWRGGGLGVTAGLGFR